MKIKEHISDYFFRKELKGFKREEDNQLQIKRFDLIKEVGFLISNPDFDENQWRKLSHFFVTIRANGKRRVSSTLFFNSKEAPDFIDNHMFVNVLTLKDLTWYGLPKQPVLTDFKSTKFDLLIDLSPNPCRVTSFLSCMSNSNLRVGSEILSDSPCYDLMIARDPELSIKDYVNQVFHYVDMLNSESYEK